MHGHHVNSPFWNRGNRKVKPVESEMTLLLTKEQTKQMSVSEINDLINETFQYDDYAWQKEKGRRVKFKDRASGLHHALYQCPACNTEHKMTSEGITISCTGCGKTWEMSELGELAAVSGETEFSHIPDWYDWQRANVRKEIIDGTYLFKRDVRIESLPNTNGLVEFPKPGFLVHDNNGFILTGEYDEVPFSLSWGASSLYGCQIEFNFKDRGDCITLSTNDDTFYIYPKGDDFSVTKILLATEEMHRLRA